MTIKEILDGQVGQKAAGFDLSIKTLKKQWTVGDIWYQQAVVMDSTGEMLVDVKLGKAKLPNTRPTLRKDTIRVHSCELQEGEFMNKPCKKLYIDSYSVPSITVDEMLNERDAIIDDYEKTIRSKILCWLTASKIETQMNNLDILTWLNDPKTKQIIDKILEG